MQMDKAAWEALLAPDPAAASALAAAAAEEMTTLARLHAVRRRDGTVFGFTDHDRDIAPGGRFGALVFRAGAALEAGALEAMNGLAVDNGALFGALSDEAIRESDIRAGRWDGAQIASWLFDWRNPAARRLVFRGTIGRIIRRDGAFEAEIRGPAEALSRPLGRVFHRRCDAVLGDGRCKVDLDAPGYAAEWALAALEDGGRVLFFAAGDGFDEGWFTHGRLEILDGAAAGHVALVREDGWAEGRRRVVLWESPSAVPVPGDRVRLAAGCDRRAETCRKKFDNLMNFRGFPHLPPEGWIALYPASGGVHDGGSLFR